MKRLRTLLVVLALSAVLLFSVGALAEAQEEPDEWTVLFYVCGSNLESVYSYATTNLDEIAQVYYPNNVYPSMLEPEDTSSENYVKEQPGKVNVLIETGGSSKWHAQDLGMDIDPTFLQRWSYHPYYSKDRKKATRLDEGFELMESLPLQSMADPQTLADFIRWGVETRPAEKYALVLWDHGDGARTGLFVDELFNKETMNLYELKQAFTDGGAYFETVIIDACLMANLETAWNIKDNARWLVASEETVPGKGTAISEWLQQLFCYPECDGEWLGRCVCDTTCIKYTNEVEAQFKDILTWSVIDLTKVDTLIEITGRLFQELKNALRYYPQRAIRYIKCLFETTEYGDGQQNMRDFGSLLYNKDLAEIAKRSTRNAAIQTLSDAVVYCVRGPGRSDARGLTFCYPANFTNEQLDVYAQNFPMPSYLAYIDALSDWTAPDWVYDYTERLPEIDDIWHMRIEVKKQLCADGMPGLSLSVEDLSNVDMVCYTLYRVNEETGETVRLGKTNCTRDKQKIWRATDPMHWPSVEGELMCMDLIQVQDDRKLYNVPVMMNSRVGILRLGRQVNYAEGPDKINNYYVYGMWEGYEENSALMNRSVIALSQLGGQQYKLLYPIDGTGGNSETFYESSASLTMYRALDVKEMPLPAGTYYLEYEVNDMYMRKTTLDRIKIQWDGENMTFPESDTWAEYNWTSLAELRREKREAEA